MFDAWDHIFSLTHEHPKFYVLLIAIFSVFANEALYQYTQAAGKRLNSALLKANAWHHRSDAASSAVVCVGVAGALLGFAYLDAVAAVIVGLMIAKMGWSLGWSSIRELIDTGVDESVLAEIKRTILASPGIETIHQLRTRSMGEAILVDVHIMVSPELTVSEGHYIATHVHHRLRKNFPKIIDVTIHVDPENDEHSAPTRNLPAREKFLPELMQVWQNCPGVENLATVNLHYLAGKIRVEVHLPITLVTAERPAALITECYQQVENQFKFIEAIRVLYE